MVTRNLWDETAAFDEPSGCQERKHSWQAGQNGPPAPQSDRAAGAIGTRETQTTRRPRDYASRRVRWLLRQAGRRRMGERVVLIQSEASEPDEWGFTSHEAKAARHPETEVKRRLRPVLAKHFDVREEVRGLSDRAVGVVLDFWCYPKPATIEKRWPAAWFGIEAKGYGLADQRKKTAARLLNQAIVYRNSKFPTPDGERYPEFVLVYPAFAQILFDDCKPGVYADTFYDGYALALAKTGAMQRVAELVLRPWGYEFDVWSHGVNRWYSSRYGRSTIDYLGAEDNHASR